MKNKPGRPTTYTPLIAQEICLTTATCYKGTKKLCKENSHWPSQDTLFRWLKKNPEFSEQYARAKCCQIEVLIDEMLEIANDKSRDNIINKNGKLAPNIENINRAKLKIDFIKWLASKLAPKVYG